MYEKIIEAASDLRSAAEKLNCVEEEMERVSDRHKIAYKEHAIAEKNLERLLDRYCYDNPDAAKRRIME